jgi:hypothetical protein
LVSAAASWVPGTLVNVIAGIGEGPVLSVALVALAAWGLIPAIVGMGTCSDWIRVPRS